MMKLNLAPKPMEGIKEKLLKSWDQELGQKYSKITKMKTLQHNIGDELTQKHDYIDTNQEFTANPRRSPSSLPHLIGTKN
jgi:hypothetical protein